MANRTNWSTRPSGLRSEALVYDYWQFNHPRNIITLHPFTITDSGTVAKVIASVGGRPCFQGTPSTSTATDGTNFCYGTAGHILQQGKQLRIWGSLRGADLINQEFFCGLTAVTTGFIATPTSDFIGIRKLTTVTQPSLVARKASGTAQDTTIPLPLGTVAVSTWYDWELVLRSDPVNAGQGTADFYWGVNVGSGTALQQIAQNMPIATQFPDTVAMGLCQAFRMGSTGNTAFQFGDLGLEIQG
jgi:hypothetical protein